MTSRRHGYKTIIMAFIRPVSRNARFTFTPSSLRDVTSHARFRSTMKTFLFHILPGALLVLTACEVRLDDERTPAPAPAPISVHEAVIDNQVDVLRRLYVEGADLNARNEQGLTPLHIAIALERDSLTRHLLEWEADPNRADPYGSSPLHMAASRDMRTVARLLIRHGADLAATDDNGYTPAEIAHFMNHSSLVDFLMAAGAEDPRQREIPTHTPQVSPRPAALAELQPTRTNDAAFRTWTSNDREQITARFLELRDEMVVLRTPDEQTIRVPVQHLHPDDRQRAQEMSRGQN